VRAIAIVVDLVLWFVSAWLLKQDRWLLGGLTAILGFVLGAWGSSNWDKWSDPRPDRRGPT
jgi:hypothetical protein